MSALPSCPCCQSLLSRQCCPCVVCCRLFILSYYNAAFVDQSLAFNRRRDDKAKIRAEVSPFPFCLRPGCRPVTSCLVAEFVLFCVSKGEGEDGFLLWPSSSSSWLLRGPVDCRR